MSFARILVKIVRVRIFSRRTSANLGSSLKRLGTSFSTPTGEYEAWSDTSRWEVCKRFSTFSVRPPPNGGETRVRHHEKLGIPHIGYSISNRLGKIYIFKCAAVEGKPNKVRYIAYMTKYEMLTSNLKKTNIMQLDPCQKWLNRNTNINILF